MTTTTASRFIYDPTPNDDVYDTDTAHLTGSPLLRPFTLKLEPSSSPEPDIPPAQVSLHTQPQSQIL